MNESIHYFIEDYIDQLKSKNVSKGYKGLMNYLMYLRTHFSKKYANELVVGSFYQGYMDMSYFSITPKSIKSKKLKIGLVFNHEKIQFELWLVGQNKKVQKEYWSLFKESNWKKYKISKTAHESIIEHVLIEKPDFKRMESLTELIEINTLAFITDIRDALTEPPMN